MSPFSVLRILSADEPAAAIAIGLSLGLVGSVSRIVRDMSNGSALWNSYGFCPVSSL